MKTNEAIKEKIYKILLERFGEPIGKTRALVGIADERDESEKNTYADDPIESPWSDGDVVHETNERYPRCEHCGEVHEEGAVCMDEIAPYNENSKK